MRVEQFWERCLKVVKRHDPRLQSWSWSARPSHLMLNLQLDDGPTAIRLEPPHEGPSWFSSPSARVCVAGALEQVPPTLDMLRALVERADKGNLSWSLPTPPSGRSAGAGRHAVVPQEQPGVREALADELHFASFLAYKSTCTEDLYPHVSTLGEVVGTDTLVEMWRHTAGRIAAGTAPQKLGLYVHIPFCTVACTFCFCSKTDDFRRQHVQRYVDDLCEEAERFGPILQGLTFTSAYFGGGTPSLLTPPQMRQMFKALWGRFHVPRGTQVIYEGNPDSLSDKKIEVLANEGKVTRLTIGVQTLDDAVQAIVKRFNRPHQVQQAIESARRHGIAHVNVDLMAGLPEQTLASFVDDLEFLISCEPDSIHVNAWRPLPRVSLAQSIDDPMTDERAALRDEMMARADEILAREGHAAHGGQGRRKTHNAANLQEYDLRRQNSSLLALGHSARGHAFGSGFTMPESPRGFDHVRNPEPTSARMYRVVPSDDVEEQHKYLVANLRTGFGRGEYRELFGRDVMEDHGDALSTLASLGAIVIGPDQIHSFTGTYVDNLIYRGLLYSPAHRERGRVVWGDAYDRDKDYVALLRMLIES